MQEDLGHQNDVRTARALTEEVSTHVNEGGNEISRAGGIVLGWHDRGLFDREPKLRRKVRRLRRAKPFWKRAELPLAPLVAPTSVPSSQADRGPDKRYEGCVLDRRPRVRKGAAAVCGVETAKQKNTKRQVFDDKSPQDLRPTSPGVERVWRDYSNRARRALTVVAARSP